MSTVNLDYVQKKIIKIYVWVLGIGLAYTALIFLIGHGIPCYFHEITGLQCPGCGSSRMFLAIFRLDFSVAFAYNPAAFISVIGWGTISVMAFLGKPGFARSEKFIVPAIYGTIILYCGLDIVRNVINFI